MIFCKKGSLESAGKELLQAELRSNLTTILPNEICSKNCPYPLHSPQKQSRGLDLLTYSLLIESSVYALLFSYKPSPEVLGSLYRDHGASQSKAKGLTKACASRLSFLRESNCSSAATSFAPACLASWAAASRSLTNAASFKLACPSACF